MQYKTLLYDALASDYGTEVETEGAERLRQKLYAIRKSDPSFFCLSFVISPLNGVDLWILKRPEE